MTARRYLLNSTWLLFAGLTGCISTSAGEPVPHPVPAKQGVEFKAIAAGVWTHTSYRHLPDYGPVPSNGLVIDGRDGAVIVDTAWTPEQTVELLDWVEANVGKVRAVIVTHWHADRTGGLSEVHRRQIPSFGFSRTVEQARTHSVIPPTSPFSGVLDLHAVGVTGEVFFPGAGHSVDNVVVWLSDARVLFGGCLVRSAAAKNMGNTLDADLDSWPSAIERLQSRYSDVSIVIPGHGPPGDARLLAHTASLASSDQNLHGLRP